MQAQGMRQQIIMLHKNAALEVPPNTPGFYSNVFLECKASGGWHPVMYLKQLNAHAHHIRIFTISSVLNTVKNGDYAFKIDPGYAYFHLPIHPDLRFTYKNTWYQFQVLPFGLSTALQVFTCLGHLHCYLHCQRILVLPYLNDWL